METVKASAAGTVTLGGDLTVNRLGFGGMRLTGPGVWGPPADPANSLAVLRRAVELGCNFIDTADAYGPEVNEDQIAEALYPYPADLVIATKGGCTRSGPGEWGRDCRPERLKACCDASLKRLRLERIDLYQLHAADPAVPYAEQVGALKELQDAGKVRHIGISNVDEAQLKIARSVTAIAAVQNRYSATNRASEGVLEACEAAGIAFIPWFPLDAGDLVDGSGLAAVAQAKGVSPYQVALAWLLRRSPLMLPIPGTSSIDHLEENVAAAALTLSDDEFAQIG